MPHIKINFFLAFLMISTVSQPCISAAAPASGARHAHRQVIEKDNTLSMPCVFDAIDVGKLSILQQNIQAIFPDQQLLRQYLALCNQSDPLTKNQLAYHLVCLTALGPRLVRELRAADYDWMCNEGWGEKIYTFFSDPQNHDTRQMLWVIMNNLNFVNTSVKDVKMDFYNPHKLLTDMVKSSPKPVTIVIGGNRLPQSYQTVDPAHHNEYDQLVNTAFGSSGYLTSYPSDITIGVDHRHRPLVLANAIDVNLWKGLDAERVREILLEEDYLKDNLMEILPEPLKGKVRIVDPYASQ